MTRVAKPHRAERKDRANPQVVADVIARVLETPQPKLRYVVGNDASMALRLRRILPAAFFERIIVKTVGQWARMPSS